jgi:hypothetical protein
MSIENISEAGAETGFRRPEARNVTAQCIFSKKKLQNIFTKNFKAPRKPLAPKRDHPAQLLHT